MPRSDNSTADLDQQDRNLGQELFRITALTTLEGITIALAALQDILKSPVENSHGLARIALDRIKALK
jgi:hypothetical protein